MVTFVFWVLPSWLPHKEAGLELRSMYDSNAQGGGRGGAYDAGAYGDGGAADPANAATPWYYVWTWGWPWTWDVMTSWHVWSWQW